MSDNKEEQLSFEDALSELESLVDQMEKGEMTLEESLASFERGVKLTRTCEQALKAAEQKVEILTQSGDEDILQPFETED